MDAKRILNYLKQLMANNNREWYWANKAEYDAIRADFEVDSWMKSNSDMTLRPSASSQRRRRTCNVTCYMLHVYDLELSFGVWECQEWEDIYILFIYYI